MIIILILKCVIVFVLEVNNNGIKFVIIVVVVIIIGCKWIVVVWIIVLKWDKLLFNCFFFVILYIKILCLVIKLIKVINFIWE